MGTVVVDQVLGHPAHPLSRDAHLAKFRRNLTYGAAPISDVPVTRLIAGADALDTLTDVRPLIADTVP